MIRACLRLLGGLHARGFHAAVLAALVVMPTVAATGYLTRDADPETADPVAGASLRPSLDETDDGGRSGLPR